IGMAKDELIDAHVSLQQCEKAIKALHSYQTKKYAEMQENELLPGKEEYIWLNVTVKRVSPTLKIKPVRIPIVHPIVDPRTTPVCLITKDPQREYKDLLETHKIKFISRVVGLTKLKGKFKPFDARRALLKEYGLFLADDRVIPTLPRLLGSKWFEAKKQPIPVSLTKKDLKKELERAISSTYMNQNRGTCTSIRIGTLSQKPSQISENLKTALPAIVQHIKDGWDNIQSLFIKTNSSVSLPIWTCSLDDTKEGRWDGLTAEAEDEQGGSEDGEGDSDAEPTPEIKRQSGDLNAKGKKRVSEEDNEDEEKPNKKPKKNAEDGLKRKTKDSSSKPTPPKGKASISPQTAKAPKHNGTVQRERKKTDESPKIDTSDEVTKKTLGKVIKESHAAVQEVPRTLSVTSATLKQKRMKDSSERKKEKMLNSKGDKSIKAKVTGKKAAKG
ncbi:ribosomal protein L1p/L10e family-domain-containing protein, partial [Amanita rubescens]